MKNEKDKIKQNILNINKNKKRKEASPKRLLNNSFTKEFINSISIGTGVEEEDKNIVLAKSHFGL